MEESYDLKIGRISIISITLYIYAVASVATDEGSTLMKLSRALLIGTFLIHLCFKKKFWLNSYITNMMFFCLIAVFSIKWSINRSYASAMGTTLIVNLICIYALFNIIDGKKERLEELLKAFVIAPLFLELRVIGIGGIFAFSTQRKAGNINGNTVGVCAAFAICFAVYFIMQGQRKQWFYTMGLANLLIVILSSSRKAIFCFLIPLALLYIFNNKDNIVKNIGKIAIVLCIGILGYYFLVNIPFLYSMAGHRIESMISGLFGTDTTVVDSSTSTRLNLIQWGIEWFKKRAWLGYGIDNYRFVLHSYHPNWSLAYYAHNNYIELLVDVGIVGTLVYYLNYVRILLTFIKNIQKITNVELLFIGILVALMVSEYGLVTYYDKYIQILLLIIWMFIKPMRNSIVRGKNEKEYNPKRFSQSR